MAGIAYEPSTPAGALCWALWKTLQAYYWQELGPLIGTVLADGDSAPTPADEFSIGDGELAERVDENRATGPGGLVGEVTEYASEVTYPESLRAVSEPEIRDLVFSPGLPSEWRHLAHEFYAAVDTRLTMDEPPGIAWDEFLAYPDVGDDSPTCDDHLIEVAE